MVKKEGTEELDDDLYDEDDEDTQKDKFLTFHLKGEDYGIDIQYVLEIIGIQKITEIPDVPEFIKGVINLSGKIIPVMDVRSRFKFEPREYDDRTCIIIVNINEATVGLVVDIVNEVTNIPENQIEPPPRVSKGASSRYIKGIGKVEKEVKILLDINCLLYDKELEQVETAVEDKK